VTERAGGVDRQLAEPQDSRLDLSRSPRPPQERVNARDQHTRFDRLHHVIVGAELQAHDVVDVVVARRDDEDRQRRRRTKLFADGEAVAARQIQIEHDEVRRSALQVLDHAIAAMLDDDAKAVALQIRAHELGKTQIVFDEQDERRGIHCSDCHQKMFQGGRRL
jgi:hypothetical protein